MRHELARLFLGPRRRARSPEVSEEDKAERLHIGGDGQSADKRHNDNGHKHRRRRSRSRFVHGRAVEGGHEDEEFTDKPVQRQDRRRAEAPDEEQESGERQPFQEAAHGVEPPRAGPAVHRAGGEEEERFRH